MPVTSSNTVRLRSPENPRIGLGRYVFWFACAAVFTSIVINYSLLRGKLCVYPGYDDVVYFEQALTLLQRFYSAGMAGLLHAYFHAPPHSPFSGIVALVAFGVCGPRDWAPYAANGFVIFGFLVFLDWYTGNLPLSRKLLLIFFALTVPVMAQTVDAFRPDLVSGACAAAGAALLVRGPLGTASRRTRVIAGVFFGAAMLFKPPTFPLSLALFAIAAALSIAQGFLLGIPSTVRATARQLTECVIPAILIPLPHYLLTWRHYYNYIQAEVFGGTRDVWARQGTWDWHLRYFIDGEGGRLMLGVHIWLLASVSLGGIIYFLWARNRVYVLRFSSLAVVTLFAFTVPTLLVSKQEFYGSTFYFALILLALEVLMVAAGSNRRAWFALVIPLLILGGVFWKLPPVRYISGSPLVVARRQLVENVYAALRASGVKPTSRIYMTSSGYFNIDVLTYFALKHDLFTIHIFEQPLSDDLAIHASEIGRADFVIASERGNTEAMEGFLKSGSVQNETLALVRRNPDFELAATFPLPNRKSYFLFRRIPRLADVNRMVGLADVPGIPPHAR